VLQPGLFSERTVGAIDDYSSRETNLTTALARIGPRPSHSPRMPRLITTGKM
jgi:hypothetical protein